MPTAMQARPLGWIASGLILCLILSSLAAWPAHGAVVTPTPTPVLVRVLREPVNLRTGPGTNYPIAGAARLSDSLPLVGANAAKDWYRLANGAWVYGPLLATRPTQLPVITTLPTPPPTRTAPTPRPAAKPTALPVRQAPAVPAATAAPAAPAATSLCPDGCTTQPNASCSIKGNVNSHGERIYHTTASRSYNVTKVKPEEGDRWFCTEAEAQSAGFRAPRN